MAAPREILITSEASGQLWNTCAWDPLSGTSLMTYKGSSAGARTLCILGNDYIISAVNNKPLIHVWALQRKDQMQQRIVCPGRVSAMATSPDGAFCIAAIAEKIHVWQVNTGNLLAVLTRHYQSITCLRFTDDGSHFISGGDDNLVLVWSMSSVLAGTGTQPRSGGVEPRYTWSAHSLPIMDIHVGSGAIRCRVATASLDHTCKLWEMATGQMLCSFVFNTSIMSVVMDAGEYRLLAGAANGHIYQVNLLKKQTRVDQHIAGDSEDSLIFRGHSKQVTCLSVSMDGTMLASGSHDGNVRIWDVLSLQCVKTLPHKGPLTNVLLLPNPPNMTNPDAHPTLPLAQFKRSLYTGHQAETQFEGEQISCGTIDVRLGKRKCEYSEESSLIISRKCVSHLQNQDPKEREEENVKLTLHDQVSQLKKANQGLYSFAVKEILAQK